jgi:hypothetical protein
MRLLGRPPASEIKLPVSVNDDGSVDVWVGLEAVSFRLVMDQGTHVGRSTAQRSAG